MVGDGDAFVAGGVESMTRAPYVMLKPENAYERGDRDVVDTTLGWRFINPEARRDAPPVFDGRDRPRTSPSSAASPARSRTRSRCAASSGRSRPSTAGRFADEIVPVVVPQAKGEPIVVDRDEHPRADTTAEALARLKPAFKSGGSVTAGNSSGINDGASAVVLVEAGLARASASSRWRASSAPPSPASIRRSWASAPSRPRARRSSAPA